MIAQLPIRTDYKPAIITLSLGAGVQSTVMLLMACRGDFGVRPDVAIFSDTQWEPRGVYDHLDWLEGEVARLTNGQLPIYRVSEGSIREALLAGGDNGNGRFASVPFFTEGGGMGRRGCTREYKIAPITRKIRELLGIKKGRRVSKDTFAETWIGISTDEAGRMKPSREKWQISRWPLIEKGMSRWDCIQWFADNYPGRTLTKSACIGCPFRDNAAWREMKENDPESFSDAVLVDHAIRDGGTLRGMEEKQFMHRSLKPLDEVDFRNEEDLGQTNLFMNECEGMCGV